MGKRGPAKTPTATLEARGSWLAKTRDGEPEAEGTPQPPDWLKGVAREAWDHVLPMLTALDVVGEIDGMTLARYCDLYAQWRECREFVEEYGSTTENIKGVSQHSDGWIEVTEYPQVARSAKLHDQLLKLEREFGMTPSARASLATGTQKKESKHGNSGSPLKPRLVG